ncbi:conjugal transfer protein TrbI [Serratia marcescens]|uniref:type-F conjugative transfer system protein TrbI n=1 Tax=Serratia marcescens TaxID=615 RepID=UPI001EF64A5A|nr:type-F conjugative transfer system protein TrbI [Serratia marcescens]CAB5681121.1 conjugal transfer protein TrbI [Serratia marcescens]CAB5696501.1 conjugal transfer protein TrbI [Serratia marcescens]
MTGTELQVIERGSAGGQRSDRRLALWGCGAVVLAVLLSSLVALWLVQRQPVIVTFNMKQTMEAFYESAGKKALPPEQSKQLAERFTGALEASITHYQQRNNVIILVSPAVVGGAKDVTRELQRDIAARMQRGNIVRVGKEADL